MDDTQPSRVSDVTATRKRRSSILKSQRPPRAPLSELEFNVATPTDSAKSRRVSFSRRTGVAEFVTNEATTTWKNFYEEHNKTLESSGNDSEVNARQSVGHLGRRIFDQQFQVEAIDFATLISDGRGIETSITNIELLQTTTDDLKPTAPQHNLDLSTFTNQPSKVFGDDLNVSELGGITDKMDVNFSTIQPLSDDLDEMQKDLDRHTNARNLPDRNASKYSKIDLNSTHLTLQGNDESDMSITDTIHSPKVNVSNNVINQVEKSTDWVADKENIVVNPYIAPKESANFAVNEEPDKVLVFDGKRLTIQSEKDPLCDYREALLNMRSGIPQIKTMVPDDGNNVPENLNAQTSIYEYSKDDKIALDNSDLSMTQPLAARLETVNKRKTIVYNNDCDVSMTQALPTNIISYKEKRRTIVFDADISVTQAVSSNLIINNCPFGKEIPLEEKEESDNISCSQVLIPNILPEKTEKRKTILFSENTGNVSFTQAVSSNLILPEKRTADSVNLSVVSDLLDVVDIPMIKTDDKKQSRKTILFLEEAGNVSITQALPTKVIVSQEINLDLLGKQVTKPEFNRNTLLVDDSDISSNESVLDLIPYDTKPNDNNTTNVIDKTKMTDMASQSTITKYFEGKTENVLHSSSSGLSKCYHASNLETNKINIGASDSLTSRGKISIAFEPDLDISVTQPLPTNIIDKSKSESKSVVERSNLSPKDSKRRDTIVYDDEDISMTQALPTNAVLAAIDDVIGDKSNNEIEVAETGPSHLMSSSKDKSKVAYQDDCNISMTRALVSNIFLSATSTKSKDESELKIAEGKLDLSLATKNSDKRKTVVYENEDADISMTKALPTNVILSAINTYNNRFTETVVREEVDDKSVTQAPSKDKSNKNTTIIYGHNLADVSVTQVVPTNIPLNVVKTCDNKGLVPTQDSEEQFDVESLPEISKWTDKYGLSSGNSSTTTVTQTTEDKDSNEADISMNESDESKHTAFAVDSKKEIAIERKSLITSDPIMKPNSNAVNPIPKDLLCLQKEILKAPLKRFTLESSRLQDVMIYQTCTSAVARSEPGDQLPKASSSTTVSGTDTEIKETFFASINNINSTDSSSNSGLAIQMPVAKLDAVTSDHQIKVERSTSDSEKNYDGISQTSSVVSKIQTKVERSLFQHLLDMNDAVDAEGIDDKSLMAQTSLTTVMSQPEVETKNASPISHESLFYITKDNSDKETSEKSNDELSVIRTLAKENLKAVEAHQIPLQIEFEHFIDDVGKSFGEFEQQSLHKTKPTNRYFEKVVSPQVDKRPKTYVKENSELLDMLSKFTDQEEKENPLEPLMNESLRSIPSQERITETFKIEYKQEKEQEDRIQKTLKIEYKPEKEQDNKKQMKKIENPQPILVQKRQSVALSREDVMNNISMAQAALQQTCDTNTTANDTVDMYHDKSISPKKNVHLSPEVVKTLMFDEDESQTDIGLKHETGLSALLRKTAFGESSYMREELMNEHKSYVIPSYLKDVSDGIKALMTDLVKPSADVLPFDTSGDARLKKTTSTCSTQIQANLFQSSQIDLDLESNAGSMMSMSSPQRKLKGIIKSSINNSSSEHTSDQDDVDWVEREHSFKRSEFITDETREYTSFGRVIAFDPNNPLNNVLLAPIDFREAHKYEPSSDGSYSDNEKAGHPIQVQFKDVDKNPDYTTNYNVPFVIPNFKDIQKGIKEKSALNTKKINKDIKLNPRKDNAVVTELNTKEEEVNTNIVMRDNFRLLNESSSLTLVDDTVATLDEDLSELDTGTSKNVSRNSSKSSHYSASPAHLIQKAENAPAADLSPSEKIKKRKQSDRHRSCLSSFDVSPRMMSKVTKRARKKMILSPRFNKENTDTSEYDKSSSPPQSPPKVDALHMSNSPRSICGKNRKPGTIITVKRLIAEYDIQAIPKEIPNSNPLSVRLAKSDVISTNSSISSRSSKGRDDKGDAQSISSVCVKDMYSTDWSPEMLNKLSSRSLVEECDSNSDIVSRIHALPFIGSRECQWESLSSDQWTFRLLLGRLRLTVRLATPPENTAWGRIQPNTLVLDVTLDTHVHNMKNSIAVLCVNFAAEAMRNIIGKGCAQAKDVPVLLRRCAGIARVALGWGRAMHVAWTQLAFKLTNDGELTLKVANIPLRAVWEVSMSLSLVVEDAREVPWPRAARVRVLPALPGSPPVCVRPLRAALRRLRRDWGHAPRALWAIFKHLKYLAPDDEYLFAK